jgi:RNA polymerase sigma-70 factor (ECF subfamily)
VDERDAIQRCLAGSTDGFADIVRLYQGQILALCLRMTGSREDAADVAQQAFVNCYRHLDRYDRDLPFRPWLYRIATNECIAFLRRRGRTMTIADDAALGAASDPGAGAPALVELAADREQVRGAVARLPSQYRTVVLLYYFRELSYQEIARQTGLSVGTISTHLHRAKNLLKQMLADKEVGAVEPH